MLQHLDGLLDDRIDDFFLVDFTAAKPLADVVAKLFGGSSSHVGANQFCEQLAQKLVIDQPPVAFEQVTDVGVQGLAGFLQTVSKATQKTGR